MEMEATIEKIERQELHCHACNKYVQFDLDLSLNGNHVIECPNCKHEHCRVIKNGIITSDRWDSRNGNSGNVYYSSNYTFTSSSTWNTYSNKYSYWTNNNATDNSTGGTVWTYNLWLNTASKK